MADAERPRQDRPGCDGPPADAAGTGKPAAARRTLRIVLLAGAIATAIGGAATADPGPVRVPAGETMDFVPFPPAHVRQASPDGRYTLAIDSPDDWQSRRVRAGLYLGDRSAGRLLWQQDLPHEFGPRHSLVGNGGQVVLIDEAINTASRYAVMVIDRHGTVVATHDFDAVAAVLGLPVAAIVEQARGGSWWVAGAPVLDAATATVRVPAAGRYLGIELDTGRLLPPTDAPPAPGR